MSASGDERVIARREPAQGQRLFLGSICAAAGSFLLLLYTGVIPWRAYGRCRAIFCDSYHWQVLSFGIAVLAVGLLFFLPDERSLGKIVALVAAVALAAGILGSLQGR